MPKSKPSNTDAAKRERTERVLDVLDAAVMAESDQDAPAQASTPSEGLDALPERLRDPFAVLERGRALLQTGLPLRDSEVNTDFDDELRMVARNGKPIPEEIRQHMNRERAQRQAPVSSKARAPSPSENALANAQIRRTSKATTFASPSVQREEELEELAALLVAQSSKKDRVDLESIAAAEGITFSFGHYGNSFDGLLECRNSVFHIYINMDTNKGAHTARARFSFAHELGHYFLDWHRTALARGVPSHGSKADFESGNLAAEREADMFAAHLLLPALQVKKVARHRIDAAEVVRLAEFFCTSLSATAIRCAHLDLAPLIVMRWTAMTRAWCWSSSIYEQRTGNRAFRSIERLPLDSATRQTLGGAVDTRETITSKGTTVSTWFPGVRAGSSYDDILVEECISLGPHGALTILRPP
jgi:Zn-dependent peptidase ImmA (M78 family)